MTTPQVTIYYTHIPNHISTAWFEDALQKLPTAQQQKIKRYIRKTDAYTSLLGKLLLIKQLKKTPFSLDDIKYNPQNRPYFSGQLDFNISHSSECVICAFCEQGRLGIDIEKIKPIELNFFKKYWTKNEYQIINNQLDKFYFFWTRKEAIIKANGKGLTIPLHQFSVEKDEVYLEGQTWFLYPITITENYHTHLALDQKIPLSQILIKEIKII